MENKNISILEVGANARAFKIFLEFLKVKTLIITDIDTTKRSGRSYVSCRVTEGETTSNYTLKDFFNAPALRDQDHPEWIARLKNGNLRSEDSNIKIVHQIAEDGYHARSFEDAFIQKNLQKVKENRDHLFGLKNISDLDTVTDIYDLTESILQKKSDFASSLLYAVYSRNLEWDTPNYVRFGLEWLVE